MKKELRVMLLVLVVTVAVFGLPLLTPSVGADGGSDKDHRDHSLFCNICGPDDDGFVDEAIFCGVKKGRGYTLHISGTASGSPGSFIINFRDGDGMGFQVPAGSTYSTTHDLGGVPLVDDLVKITATGGVGSMMVSVNADSGARDPFDETLDGGLPEKDNFCTRSVVGGGAGTGEAGQTSAKALFVPPILPLT